MRFMFDRKSRHVAGASHILLGVSFFAGCTTPSSRQATAAPTGVQTTLAYSNAGPIDQVVTLGFRVTDESGALVGTHRHISYTVRAGGELKARISVADVSPLPEQ